MKGKGKEDAVLLSYNVKTMPIIVIFIPIDIYILNMLLRPNKNMCWSIMVASL